ncbi:MAG: extracellular solute-binding protein, partial [Lachnospiraceae bacterium]|nr:extracellular solute-binding protein [Lachnospiraceae bacterium]
MKRRKLISLLVVSSLCAAMFTGCGSEPAAENTSAEQTSAESTSAEKPESGETAAAEQAEEAPQETTNISVYIRGLPDTGAIDAVTQALNEYSEEKIGVTVTLSNFESGEYLDRLKMGLAAKEDIDLCWMADYTGLDDFVRQDALLDLTDLLPQYEGLYQVMPEEIWQNAQLYGRNYTVPNYKESFLGTSVMTPVAMADTIKEKYGIDFNAIECNSTMDYEVYEDYILACMAEGVEVPLPFQMQCAFNSINDDYEFTDSYYFVMDKETHKVSLWYETEEYAQHHKKMMDWKEKGIWKEEQIMSDFNHTEIMSSGNYALVGWTTVPDNQAQASTRYGVDVYVKEV